MKSFPILAALVLAGCSTSAPGPTLSSVAPARVSVFRPTLIVIRGAGIEYDIGADLDHPSQSTFTLDLHVKLIGPETVELLQLQRVSAREVTASVPPTLMLGKYSVEVSTARGAARLVDALEVANCFLDCESGPADGGCFTWPDLDNDGYGQLGSGAAVCLDAGARAAQGGDCHDADPATHPDAFELCNGIDDDCDGVIDDGTCVADGGWKVRSDTGGAGDDWETAANYGRGRIWLAEKQRVSLRAGSGPFVDVGIGCANKIVSAWADPANGLAFFGGDGVLSSHAVNASGCGTTQSFSGTIVGLQGIGGRLYGATREGALLEGTLGTVTQRAGIVGASLTDVQGATATSLFAVGSAGGRPMAWRLRTDGGEPIDENVQALAVADQSLTAVWAVDESLAYAVGSKGALLERTHGAWRALPAADGGLSAVRAFGLGRVYAATGDGRVLRYDGKTWQLLYKHPGAAQFTDITATAEDDIWVVGHNGLVVHWNE